MWDFRTINRYREALFDQRRKSRIFCSIKHSITGDIVACQSHAFSRFVEAGSMKESEILGLFMAIMYNWDVTDSKECPEREENTYEKSFSRRPCSSKILCTLRCYQRSLWLQSSF